MINYSDIISQLRANTTCFMAVSGGVSLESLDVTTNTALPAAFIVPLNFDAERDIVVSAGGLFQRITETFGIIVVINTGDLRGQQAALLIPGFRKQIWSAILNWYDTTDPDVDLHAVQGLYYVEDSFLHYDSGRTFWIFKYALDDQITDADGWQIDAPPLTDIKLNVLVNPPIPVIPVVPPVEVDVTLYPPNQTNVIDLDAEKPTIKIGE